MRQTGLSLSKRGLHFRSTMGEIEIGAVERQCLSECAGERQHSGHSDASKVIGCALVCLVVSAAAHAAEDAVDTPKGSIALEEIVVTAQKRSQSLQETPLSVTAISADALEQRRVVDVGTLTSLAPNLNVAPRTSPASGVAVMIRGVGEIENILTLDPPVGLYLDGVVLGRASGSMFELADLERIEVLRGPQGTLYGRNTTGGAVNLISRKPGSEAELTQMLSYGRFDSFVAKTTVDTGEIVRLGGLRGRLVYLQRERDGYVDNVLASAGDDPGAQKVDAGRLALSFDWGDRAHLDYGFDFSDRDVVPPALQLAAARPDVLAFVNASPLLGGAAPRISLNRLDSLALDRSRETDRVTGHTLTVEYDLSDALMLRSMSGYRDWDQRIPSQDLDGNAGLVGYTSPGAITPIGLFHTSNARSQRQFSQEFNLLGSTGRFEYVLGAFYFEESADEDNDPQSFTVVRPSPTPIVVAPGVVLNSIGTNLTNTLTYTHDSSSVAVFGQGGVRLGTRFKVTGGLRFTKDERELRQTRRIMRQDKADFTRVNWSATLEYQWTPDVMSYARVATGYKAGGFNPRSAAGSGSFGPENLISYELGAKSELLDRRLRLNATVFHSVNDDYQVSQFIAGSGGAASQTVNAGKANFEGVEVELDALVTSNLRLYGNFGYVDRQFDSLLVRDPATDALIDIADSARFQYSASTTGSVGAQYEFPADWPGQPSISVDYSYRGKQYFQLSSRFNPFNEIIAGEPAELLGARLEFTGLHFGSNVEAQLAIWGRNLTDQEYRVTGLDLGSLGSAGVIYGEPRTFGVDFTVGWKPSTNSL